MTSVNIEIGWGCDHHRHEDFARHPKDQADLFIEQFPSGNARWVGVLDVPLDGDRTEQNNRKQEERTTSQNSRART